MRLLSWPRRPCRSKEAAGRIAAPPAASPAAPPAASLTFALVVPVAAFLAALLLPEMPALAADDTAVLASGKDLFLKGTVPSCAVCHTLQEAGAEGAIGPVLDELKPDAARVAKALRDGLGQMPSFKDRLTEDQIAALALYVAKASGGAP